jgi:hypothetical protein
LQEKKMRRKKDFFGTVFAMPYWHGHLAQDLLMAAILADRGQNLPFWQMPLFIGVETFLRSSTPQSGYHNQ